MFNASVGDGPASLPSLDVLGVTMLEALAGISTMTLCFIWTLFC
jgi:hypothetical protein